MATFSRKTPGSRTLNRGLSILRAFRQGGSTLSNTDLAERSGLPKPTISRLTHSLVEAGFLLFDFKRKAYRLSPIYLNLALIYNESSEIVKIATPIMESLAETANVNVGLASADLSDIVYLASIRGEKGGFFRQVTPGSRRPVETLSLGLSYLNAVDEATRTDLIKTIAARQAGHVEFILDRIAKSRAQLRTHGYCVANWHSGLIAISRAVSGLDDSIYSINISFSPQAERDADHQTREYGQLLTRLADDIARSWQETLLDHESGLNDPT
ncbi:IclR family transcriptional regulator [Ottowia pentelensis]|uniref:IclR family transcriptional regulator n=1 Tax=Ottowia pentelensis TaxID=511108 RepID=A0ABV6PXR8_9BURK